MRRVEVLACLYAFGLLACGSSASSGGAGGGGAAGAGANGGSDSGTGGHAGSANTGTGGTSTGGTSTGGTSTGGTSTGGTSTGGASAGGAGTGGSATGGTGGVFTPPTCANPNSALPADAPALTQAVWKDISPAGGGLSWGTNLTQGMALDPCNAATLYLAVCAVGGNAAYPKGVYRTTDAGTSWTRILPDDSPNHIRVDPKNPLNLYVTDGVAGGTAGFYRTTDGGKNWNHVTNMCDVEGITSSCGMNDLYDVAVDPTDFKHLLISFHSPWTWGNSSQGAGILESKDGGDHWIAHHWPNNWGYGHSIDFLYRPNLGIGTSGTWLLGIQNGGGRWRTTDAGATWTKVSDISIVHGGGNVYYTKAGVLYASADPGVIKSTDNGATWTSLGGSFGDVSVFGDGKLLYTAPLFGPTPFLVASESNDKTWTNYNTQQFSQGPFEMAFDATNGILYAANNQAGMWALKVK